MKRLGLVLAGLALAGAVNTADAQLTMQMSNGWSATFAGNVNAFWIYTDNQTADDLVDGADFSSSGKTNGIGTGLLPAFFTFEAKGKEGNTDLRHGRRRRPDRHASGLPDRRRHLGSDPRR